VWWTDVGADTRARVAAIAGRVCGSHPDSSVASILSLTHGDAAWDAIAQLVSQAQPHLCDAEELCALGTALHVVGDFGRSSIYLAEAIGALRRDGAQWQLPEMLTHTAWNAVGTGDLSAAITAARDAVSVAGELRQPLWEAAAKTALAAIAAISRDTLVAEALLSEAEAIAIPRTANAVLVDIQFVRAVLASSAGRHEEAFEHLQRTFDPDDPAHHHVRSAWRIGEFAEAALHTGNLDAARTQLARCEARVRRARSPHLEAGIAYARPLVAHDERAEALFRAALRADLRAWPLQRARLLLQYGTWLRRQRRVVESRLPLRTARDSLLALGAIAFVDRARQELRAAREIQHSGPGAWQELTEQELQIAHLVAQGLTNREIAQRLYISPRTVGSHLYKIFPKLGIANRGQLARVL
jgi:ATP/maltotriose-dependent transcriptional regulator MalT